MRLTITDSVVITALWEIVVRGTQVFLQASTAD